MLATATVTRIVLVIRDVHHPGIWCNTLARLDPIAGGALLACFLNGALPEHAAALASFVDRLRRGAAHWLRSACRQRRMAGPGHVSSGGCRFGGDYLRHAWCAPPPAIGAQERI